MKRSAAEASARHRLFLLGSDQVEQFAHGFSANQFFDSEVHPEGIVNLVNEATEDWIFQ